MFDVGFWEVALIGIVTLLVVGPDRLPEVARTAGKWVLKARRFIAGVKSDFNRELQTGDLHKILGDQKEQINELRSMVNTTRRDLETSTSDAVASAKSTLESVEDLGKASFSAKSSASSADSSNAEADQVDKLADQPATNPVASPGGTIPVQAAEKTAAAVSTDNANPTETGSDSESVNASKDS